MSVSFLIKSTRLLIDFSVVFLTAYFFLFLFSIIDFHYFSLEVRQFLFVISAVSKSLMALYMFQGKNGLIFILLLQRSYFLNRKLFFILNISSLGFRKFHHVLSAQFVLHLQFFCLSDFIGRSSVFICSFNFGGCGIVADMWFLCASIFFTCSVLSRFLFILFLFLLFSSSILFGIQFSGILFLYFTWWFPLISARRSCLVLHSLRGFPVVWFRFQQSFQLLMKIQFFYSFSFSLVGSSFPVCSCLLI